MLFQTILARKIVEIGEYISKWKSLEQHEPFLSLNYQFFQLFINLHFNLMVGVDRILHCRIEIGLQNVQFLLPCFIGQGWPVEMLRVSDLILLVASFSAFLLDAADTLEPWDIPRMWEVRANLAESIVLPFLIGCYSYFKLCFGLILGCVCI